MVLMDLPGCTFSVWCSSVVEVGEKERERDRGLRFLLSLSLGLRQWVNRDRGTAVFTAAFSCTNLSIQHQR